MSLIKSFGLSIFIVEGVIPLFLILFNFLGWMFGNKGVGETSNVIVVIVTIGVQSVIPWWLNWFSVLLVIILTGIIFAFLNR